MQQNLLNQLYARNSFQGHSVQDFCLFFSTALLGLDHLFGKAHVNARVRAQVQDHCLPPTQVIIGTNRKCLLLWLRCKAI